MVGLTQTRRTFYISETKIQEMAKSIVGARKLGRKTKKLTKPNDKRGTRASVVPGIVWLI